MTIVKQSITNGAPAPPAGNCLSFAVGLTGYLNHQGYAASITERWRNLFQSNNDYQVIEQNIIELMQQKMPSRKFTVTESATCNNKEWWECMAIAKIV